MPTVRATQFKAAIAVAAGALTALVATPADAGIITSGTVNALGVPGLTSSRLAGVDPATQSPSLSITSSIPAGTLLNGGGGASVSLTTALNLTQSYNPLLGPVGSIISAHGDTTGATFTNVGGVDATVVLNVTYDAFNYPAADPKTWVSTIAATLLSNGATFGSVVSLKDANNFFLGTVNHNTLVASGEQSITTAIASGAPYSVVQTLTVFLPVGAEATIGQSATFSTDTVAVPEPATLALLGAGLLGLAAVRRRKAS